MTQWTKEFETGFPELDAQHRKLFEMIDQITELLEAPTLDDQKVLTLVTELENYARCHFECEERCMAETLCPAREVNIDAHRTFLEGVVRLKHDFADKGEKREFLAVLQASLRAWLRNHILRIDATLKNGTKTN